MDVSSIQDTKKGGKKVKENPEEEYKIPQESKVGKKLSDLTTWRVIILVLAMMFSVPLFDLQTYIDNISSYEFGLSLI